MKLVSSKGIIFKSVIGLLICSFIIFYFVINKIYLFPANFLGLILLILLGIISYISYTLLYKDRGSFINTLLWLFNIIITGLIAGNAVNVIANNTALITNNPYLLVNISKYLVLALIITLVLTLVGVFLLPHIHKINYNQKIFKLVFILTIFTSLGIGITSIVAFILSLLGFDWLWNFYLNLIYGDGIISIVLSLFFIICACWAFSVNLLAINTFIDKQPQYLEFYCASIIINSIINIFLEVFQLILKIFANSDDN